jgi:polar amino acid transport system substrate-binding protein
MSRRRVASVAVLLAATLTAAGCVSTSNRATQQSLDALASPTSPAAGPTTTTTPPPACDRRASLRPTGSLPAPGQMPANTWMREIQNHGRLVVGVDQNTLLFGYRDPRTGTLQGYEIDLLKQLALAILGDENAIEFKTLTTAQRIAAVADPNSKIDVVASLVTMTCTRWQQVSFTTEYYEAAQQVLVHQDKDMEPEIRTISDLAGKRVCATQGSTSIDNLRQKVPAAIAYPVAARTDCLVAFQAGKVDAITADNTILLGFQKQDDRATAILPELLSDEPYGMIIRKDHPEFVRYVNAVLQRLRDNGTLNAIDKKWLGEFTERPTPVPPAPRYQD